MRARVYTRVSTDRQVEEGFSLAAQRERLAAYCAAQGWPIADWYEDDGYSAATADRPALKRLISDIEPGDVLLVYRLDRLTRSVINLHALLQTLEAKGAAFRSATEVFDTTSAIGRLFLTIVAAMAQWERENLAERVRMGMTQAAKEAKWLGGPAPYGYQVVEQALIPDPQTAPIVRWMYERYLAGAGVRTVAVELARRGVSGPQGKMWHDQTVSLILRNPCYRGALSWGRRKGPGGQGKQDMARAVTVEGTHEALVSPETWREAQRVKAARVALPMRTAASIHALTGVLFCGLCGARVSGHLQKKNDAHRRNRDYRHYRCQARMHQKTCTLPHFNADALEAKVLEAIEQISSPADWKRRMAMKETGGPSTAREEAALLQRIRRLEKTAKRVDYDYRAGELGARAYSRQLDAIDAERTAAETRLGEIEAAKPNEADPQLIAGLFASVRHTWFHLTPEERRELIRKLLRRVVVQVDGSVIITTAWD